MLKKKKIRKSTMKTENSSWYVAFCQMMLYSISPCVLAYELSIIFMGVFCLSLQFNIIVIFVHHLPVTNVFMIRFFLFKYIKYIILYKQYYRYHGSYSYIYGTLRESFLKGGKTLEVIVYIRIHTVGYDLVKRMWSSFTSKISEYWFA